MDNKDQESCGTDKKGKCCGGKAVCVAVLLLIGGLVGFCIGNCKGKVCPLQSKAAIEQPATTPAAQK